MGTELPLSEAELLGAGFEPFGQNDAKRVTAPTLLVEGERSPAFFSRIHDKLERLLPDMERVKIPGASQLMHEQNPRAYNEAVLKFLSQH